MVSEKVYAGLHNVVDCRRISRFIQDLARSYILSPNVDEAYGQMAKDESREAEALNGLNPGSEMSVMKSLDVKSGSGQFLTPMRVLPACSKRRSGLARAAATNSRGLARKVASSSP